MTADAGATNADTPAPLTPDPVTPDPPPLGDRVVLRQRWDTLAYLHWRYDPEVVQALLPPGVRVDVCDGSAWVGLVPFVMRRVRFARGPAFPVVGTFVEINVRTYVIDQRGRRSVWFFSLDVPRPSIVAVARTAFALPYCWSSASYESKSDDGGCVERFTMRRRWPRAGAGSTAEIVVRPGARLADDEVDELTHFLTARWSLLTTRRGRVLRGAVDHPRWPLHAATCDLVRQDVIEAAGLPSPVGEPLVHWSPGVDVAVGWLRK